VHRELADDGLAGPGGRGDEDPLAVLDVPGGLLLEVIEGELERLGELPQVRIPRPVGWVTCLPENTFGNTRMKVSLESSLRMSTSRSPSSIIADGTTFIPPP